MIAVNIILIVFILIGILLALFAQPIARRLKKANEYHKQILEEYYPDKEFVNQYFERRKPAAESSFEWIVGIWIWRIIALSFAGIALYLLIKFN